MSAPGARRRWSLRTLPVPLGLLALGACTTLPEDGGVGEVGRLVESRAESAPALPAAEGPPALSEAELAAMLGAPLSLGDAERLAILYDPRTRATLARVGVAEADYAQAGRLENPGLAIERLAHGEERTTSMLFDIGGVLLLPLKRRVAERGLEAARYQAADAVLAQIAETRRAWFTAVAERQRSALAERALESVETAGLLTRQMAALGHSGALDQARAELTLARQQAALTRQRRAERAAREALIRRLGLWGEAARALTLPQVLPAPPEVPRELPAVERTAIERRLDVQIARLELEALASDLELTRVRPWLTGLEAGPVREHADGDTERGFEIELRLPIFDLGDVKTAKARFRLRQARAQAEATAIAAASIARESYDAYRTARDLLRHMETTMRPLRERISREAMLQYNGMLISVFDLLEDVVDATALDSAHVDALRDFWIADTELQYALTGSGGSALVFAAPEPAASADADAGH